MIAKSIIERTGGFFVGCFFLYIYPLVLKHAQPPHFTLLLRHFSRRDKNALQLIISISLDPGVGAGFTLPSEDVMKWLATN